MPGKGKAGGQQAPADPKAKFTVSHIFKVQRSQLREMFAHGSAAGQASGSPEYLPSLYQPNGQVDTEGVIAKLATDANIGIVGDRKDLQRRRHVFGTNQKPRPRLPTLCESIKDTLSGCLWWVVGVTALLSGVCGWISVDEEENHNTEAITEAISILVAAFFLITVTSVAAWRKDQEFVQLQTLIKDEKIPVVRGKYGTTKTVKVWDLVVGDVVLLAAGARVPADCLAVEAESLEVLEPVARAPPASGKRPEGDAQPAFRRAEKGAAVNAAERNRKPERQSRGQNSKVSENGPDPFLLAGSVIQSGHCRAVVCAVGEYSTRGIVDSALKAPEGTTLQRKLKNLEDQFSVRSLVAAAIIFVVLMVRMGIRIARLEEGETGDYLLRKLPQHLNLVVVLIIVSVPEGLKLTLGVSIAFSVMAMYRDGLLIRKLDAPEKMGGVSEICCGKTGTLTENSMKVTNFYCQGLVVKRSRNDTLRHCDLTEETHRRIIEGMLYNCEARMETDSQRYVPVGSATEVAFLKFLQDASEPVHLIIQRKYGQILGECPFSPDTRRSAVVMQSPEHPKEQVLLYVKGAPEMITDLCTHHIARKSKKGAEAEALNGPGRQKINEKVSEMARKSLRVIGFAFAEMTRERWNAIRYEVHQYSSSKEPLSGGQTLEAVLKATADGRPGKLDNLTFLGAFGLQDAIRPKAHSCIQYARGDAGAEDPANCQAQINIRMVSGDHVDTARSVAVKVGILTEEEAEQVYKESDKDKKKCYVMTGAQLRKAVGGLEGMDEYQEFIDAGGPEPRPARMAEFERIARSLKVLARATPADRRLFVAGLKALPEAGDWKADPEQDNQPKRCVACTGWAAKDALALSEATVGFSLGSGCAAAKDASDLILTQGDLEAGLRAVMWGRNIYDNISRFLQFQVAVNISVLLTVLIGILKLAESPMSAVQLLWVNLLMDTFAAFALATEPPLPAVIKDRPHGVQTLMSGAVWRQIIGISCWNLLVMIAVICFGDLAFLDLRNNVDDPAGIDFETDDQRIAKHKQYIFNTFVFMAIFNEINCRKVKPRDFNVFEEFFHNANFLLVVFGTFAAQFAWSVYGLAWWYKDDEIMRGTTLTASECANCVTLGATPLIVAAVLKLTPVAWVDKAQVAMQLDEDTEQQSGALDTLNKVTAMKVGRGKKAGQAGEGAGKDGDDYEQV